MSTVRRDMESLYSRCQRDARGPVAAGGTALWRSLLVLTLALLTGLSGLSAQAQDAPTPPPPEQAGRLTFEMITPEQLEQSLQIGTDYLLRHQLEAGNFGYLYDFSTRKYIEGGDNSVRQAGALWILATLHRRNPDPKTAAAVFRAVEFWSRHSRFHAGTGGMYPIYPGETVGKTGTVALIVLGLTEVLRQPEGLTPEMRRRYTVLLEQYAIFLLYLRREDGHFYGGFDAETGKADGFPSPYSCGESLLAMLKVCKYLDRPGLKDMILESAEVMYANYVEQALAREPDSDITKGFFQWGLMSMHEIYTTDWDPELRATWGERAVPLGLWMIDTHKVLLRTRNTGYAMEGMIAAGDIARRMGNKHDEWVKLRVATAVGMTKLATWQVGGVMPNTYLRRQATLDPRAVGGVMDGDADPKLRIDTTQHQIHAVAMMIDLVLPELDTDEDAETPAAPTPDDD